jgi:hypothetical protein
MNKYLPFLVFVLFLSDSCIMGQNKKGTWENEKIDPNVRATMAKLNEQVYRDMCDNNYDALSHMFSDTLKERLSSDFSTKFMPQMQRVMKGRKFKVFDEFYIKTDKPTDTIFISSGKGNYAWSMKFLHKFNETYLTMLVSGDSINEVMLTLLYERNKGKWELFGIRGEDYSLNTKNAIDQYLEAQRLQQNGSLMDAVNVMALANHCLTPGGNNFAYKNAAEMKQYTDSLNTLTKAKYPFPYTVNEVKTKPLVVNIHYEIMQSKFVPMIIYQSTINVMDTVALKTENNEVQQKIGAIFTGMDRNNKSIIYRAYNDLPNGQNDPRYYTFIQDIN